MIAIRNTWRASVRAALVGTIAFSTMGMGGGSGGGEESTIPIPARNFSVLAKDVQGNAMRTERFTCDGKVYFRGRMGRATITLPFAKVRKVIVSKVGEAGDSLGSAVKITLKREDGTPGSGDVMALELDRGSKCYGETRYGDYEILLRDLAELEFE